MAKDYTIVKGNGDDIWEATNRLEEKVKKLITDGWKIQGGVSTSTEVRGGYTQEYFASQAMIKE